MEIRLLAEHDAEAWWHLRLKGLRNDPAAFADSAEEHLATTVESAKERLRAGDPARNFIVGMFENGELAATAGFYRQAHLKAPKLRLLRRKTFRMRARPFLSIMMA